MLNGDKSVVLDHRFESPQAHGRQPSRLTLGAPGAAPLKQGQIPTRSVWVFNFLPKPRMA